MSTDPDTRREINPFAAPRIADAVEGVPVQPDEIKVQGQYLVVGQHPVLPDRCVINNDPATYHKAYKLQWAPSFQLAMKRRTCHLVYAVGKRYRLTLKRRMWKRIGVASLIAIPTFFLLGFSVTSFVIVMTILHRFIRETLHGPLTIFREYNGRFWLRGCGPEFLRSCEEEFGKYDGAQGRYE